MARIVVILAACAVLRAADEPKPPPELPPALRSVVELARTGAPEFFADTIMRQVETGKVPGRELQAALLMDAFTAAQQARQPLRLIGIPPTPPDTRAMYRGKAGDLLLDALSLESRVLKALLAVDRAKARELFEHVPHPALEARPCEDPLVADASAYYEAAGAVAQAGFTPAEKEKEIHVQFLTTVLAGTRSPNELAAFARTMQAVDLKPAEWELLLSSFAGKLEAIAADYRPFAMSIGELSKEIEKVAERAQAAGLRTDLLARSFRTYLVTQLTSPRCEEDFGEVNQTVEWFNSRFRGAQPAISEQETRPSKRAGAFKVETYFRSDDSKSIAEAYSLLGRVSAGERSTGEWRNRLADFLRDLEAWRSSGSAVDFFHQKATVLRGLLQLAPPGEDRDRIIDVCLSFLQSSEVQQESPAEWLWQVRTLVQAAGADARLLLGFRNSGNAGLVLYAQ